MYIDGFNMYYGALKGSNLKWLDLAAWSGMMLPGYDIDLITYCTARIVSRPSDPDANVRQDAYLRALATLPSVRVLEGKFKSSVTKMLRVPPGACSCCAGTLTPCVCCGDRFVKVEKSEEKGSDVNLAVELVADGFRDNFDTALVVSDDSDIQPAVDIVRGQLGKQVFIANPRNRRYHSLQGDERRQVRSSTLLAAQFPDQVIDVAGRVIHKPTSWA